MTRYMLRSIVQVTCGTVELHVPFLSALLDAFKGQRSRVDSSNEDTTNDLKPPADPRLYLQVCLCLTCIFLKPTNPSQRRHCCLGNWPCADGLADFVWLKCTAVCSTTYAICVLLVELLVHNRSQCPSMRHLRDLKLLIFLDWTSSFSKAGNFPPFKQRLEAILSERLLCRGSSGYWRCTSMAAAVIIDLHMNLPRPAPVSY